MASEAKAVGGTEVVGSVEQAVLEMTDMVEDDTRNALAFLARAIDTLEVSVCKDCGELWRFYHECELSGKSYRWPPR